MCVPEDHEANNDGRQYKTQKFLIPRPVAGVSTDGELVLESFPLTFQGYTYQHGHIAYIRGRPPAPVVMVHHNYAGLKQFDIDQACFLARCGYVGLAVDHYKETELIGCDEQSLQYRFEDRDPKRDFHAGGGDWNQRDLSPSQLARATRHGNGSKAAMYGLLRTPIFWRELMQAWLTAARGHPAVHPTYAGAIGYCLGGQALLEQVRGGQELQAVVSFHGLLHSRPPTKANENKPRDQRDPRGGYFERMSAEEFAADTSIVKAEDTYAYKSSCKVLIENGDLDDHVPVESLDEFRAEMDAQGIDWRVNNHARTPHGFALAPGMWGTAYTEDADRRSTLSMLQLFAEVWPEFEQHAVATNACGTVLGQAVRVHDAKARL